MPDSTARYITIYDFVITPARIHNRPPTPIPPAAFYALRDAAKAALHNCAPLCDDEDERGRRLYLMDLEIYEPLKAVAFVWTLADQRAAAQVYLRRGQATLRPAAKDDDEDVAISAHLVIDLEVDSNVMRYLAALEDHEGISRLRVQRCLQTLLQDYMPTVTALLDEGIEKSGPPKVIMDAHPGRLINGTELKPIEIEVLKQTPRKKLSADAADAFYQSSERRVFKLANDGPVKLLRSAAVEYVQRLRGQFPDHRIRVRWRDLDDETNRTEVTTIDPLQRPEALLERALTRTEYLENFRGLPDATQLVVRRLALRMVEVVRTVLADDRRPR